MRSNYLNISLLLILACILVSCLHIDEIDYIPFAVDFQAPTNVRIQEKIHFIPGKGTNGAQSFYWQFGDQDSTTSKEKEPLFSFDTLGQFNVQLTAEIQKTNGFQKATFSKKIRVLPTSDSLTGFTSLGSIHTDEIPQDFCPARTDQNYVLLGRKNLNTLDVYLLDHSFGVSRKSEVSNLASGQIVGKAIKTTSDQGILIVGSVQSGIDERDAFIVKLDSLGNIGESASWQKVVTSIKDEAYNSVVESIQEQDTSYFAIGTVINSSSPTILIDRYSPQGKLLNSQSFENLCANCRANAAILVADGQENSLVVAGNNINAPTLFRFSLLNQVADLVDFSSVNLRGEGMMVKQLSDGKFALAGSIDSGTDSTRAFVAKLDVVSQGVIPAWVTEVALYQENFQDINEDENGNIIAVGNHFNPLSHTDILFVKMDTFTGKVLKIRLLGGDGTESGIRLWKDKDRYILIGSQIKDAGFGFRDIIIGQISTD